MGFGTWLKSKREEAGLSQEDLGAAVGLSHGMISQIESERVGKVPRPWRPRPEIVRKMTRTLRAAGVAVSNAEAFRMAGFSPDPEFGANGTNGAAKDDPWEAEVRELLHAVEEGVKEGEEKFGPPKGSPRRSVNVPPPASITITFCPSSYFSFDDYEINLRPRRQPRVMSRRRRHRARSVKSDPAPKDAHAAEVDRFLLRSREFNAQVRENLETPRQLYREAAEFPKDSGSEIAA